MEKQFRELVYTGFWGLLDWVYPPVCAVCGEPGDRLCNACQAKIQFISEPLINRGNQNDSQTTHEGNTLINHLSHCQDIRHLAIYEGVIRECIHALKYENNQSLGETFSKWLADVVRAAHWSVDLVIPVALSVQRVRERGYNQAALIAKPLAFRLGVGYAPFALKRIRHTPSQVGLSAQERQNNVAGAFEAVPEIVEGKGILLVDDVMTTGATINACAAALSLAGSNAVYAITIAGFPKNILTSEAISNQV